MSLFTSLPTKSDWMFGVILFCVVGFILALLLASCQMPLRT
jgi:hypothetical protein